MSYRIASAMVVLSVLLAGCARGSQVPAQTAMAARTLEPQPSDPQCGACAPVYSTGTQEVYARFDTGVSMPAVNLTLFTTAGDSIGKYQGLEPRTFEPGTAVYAVAGGPEMDVGYGLLTWTGLDNKSKSMKVVVQTSFLGWPTTQSKYNLESSEKREGSAPDAAEERRERGDMGRVFFKAKVSSEPARKLVKVRRVQTAPKAKPILVKIRPPRVRRVELRRKPAKDRISPRR